MWEQCPNISSLVLDVILHLFEWSDRIILKIFLVIIILRATNNSNHPASTRTEQRQTCQLFVISWLKWSGFTTLTFLKCFKNVENCRCGYNKTCCKALWMWFWHATLPFCVKETARASNWTWHWFKWRKKRDHWRRTKRTLIEMQDIRESVLPLTLLQDTQRTALQYVQLRAN